MKSDISYIDALGLKFILKDGMPIDSSSSSTTRFDGKSALGGDAVGGLDLIINCFCSLSLGLPLI
jgi:hypothetical protein